VTLGRVGAPDAVASYTYNFTGQADGNWGSQAFSLVVPNLTADTKYLTIALVLQNHNHDRYVAADIGPRTSVPDAGATWTLLGLGLAAPGAVRMRFARKQGSIISYLFSQPLRNTLLQQCVGVKEADALRRRFWSSPRAAISCPAESARKDYGRWNAPETF
jgi:hypothetical protein